jgi:hypothetical protein
MDLDQAAAAAQAETPEAEAKPQKEYYHDNKNRIFVRAIQGAYSLNDELKRLRAMLH